MAGKKANKIMEIVRLQQILKKWKKLANASKTTNTTTSNKGIKFLKKTVSFTETHHSVSATEQCNVPKGYLAVSVGKQQHQQKRYVIPTQYLGRQAFRVLLREAEEEFGFQQQGVLKIPCDVAVFEMILKIMEEKIDNNNICFLLPDDKALKFNQIVGDLDGVSSNLSGCYSPSDNYDAQVLPSLPQLCR